MAKRARRSRGRVGTPAAAAAIGYLAGLFPSADLASKFAGKRGRVREFGSKNPGATNAMKVLGPRWGASVLIADVAKGALATHFGRWIAGENGAAAAGTGAVLGHCFPLCRRGGKGVATRYGAIATVAPDIAILDLAVAAGVARSTKCPAVAMAISTVTSVIAGIRPPLHRRRLAGRCTVVVLTAVSGAVVLVRFVQEQKNWPEPRRPPRRIGQDSVMSSWIASQSSYQPTRSEGVISAD
jgi:glycerol-3-phosphate acyltransferase PlsY